LLALSVIVVLLLVVVPAVIYLLGWAVTRYTKKPVVRVSVRVASRAVMQNPISETPAKAEV
jgi:hypothetical protein